MWIQNEPQSVLLLKKQDDNGRSLNLTSRWVFFHFAAKTQYRNGFFYYNKIISLKLDLLEVFAASESL